MTAPGLSRKRGDVAKIPEWKKLELFPFWLAGQSQVENVILFSLENQGTEKEGLPWLSACYSNISLCFVFLCGEINGSMNNKSDVGHIYAVRAHDYLHNINPINGLLCLPSL